MTTHSTGHATPMAAISAPRSGSAYRESGTVYYWDETGSFSAEFELTQWAGRAANQPSETPRSPR